ncbi:hypothetical protein L2E82_16215 [Cichorium intybus]|uniref:Uncharacterized protein n=1 Tax=Cichorium intybus TaxID=13427 RepID=A0ACB9F4G0_CICIN|nr:hypothetical protein L2E82_16215 [Cichorium intybus]
MADGGGSHAAERLSQKHIGIRASQKDRGVAVSQKERGIFTFEDYKLRITCSVLPPLDRLTKSGIEEFNIENAKSEIEFHKPVVEKSNAMDKDSQLKLVIRGRAEDVGQYQEFREVFDVTVARDVA